MAAKSNMESMLELFHFETSQDLNDLEQSIIKGEQSSTFSDTTIDEVFRIMHNIKSSAAMMLLSHISSLAHHMEDLFFFLREEKPTDADYSYISDLVLDGVDFIKVELEKIKNGDEADGDNSSLIKEIENFLEGLKQENTLNTIDRYTAVVYFEKGCEMENIRAFNVVHQLQKMAEILDYYPADIMENEASAQEIQEQGFKINFNSDYTKGELQDFFYRTAFIRDLELTLLAEEDEVPEQSLDLPVTSDILREEARSATPAPIAATLENEALGIAQEALLTKEIETKKEKLPRRTKSAGPHMISVHVEKLDTLMDLVGEMVIAEAMVTQNPDLKDLELDNFLKAARQLRKITSEVQDIVTSIRMVPLAVTFQKMNRIVRDMSKKLNKHVIFEIIGEDTEVDKNIIEQISDPLMHLIRNAIDHGLESKEEREAAGKTEPAKVIIKAENAGSEVLISVTDNGRGLNKDKILARAEANGLLRKSPKDMSDREIYNLIFLAGFSTKPQASEFSGRGVGMDVVTKNIESIGGMVLIDSTPQIGTTVNLKIPLTLAIIDGMNIQVGESCYTLPITAIKEAFRPGENGVFQDPDGHEMIMVRGECLSITRLHELFNADTEITDFSQGILIIIENDEKQTCLFADAILGEQQVVVKAMPSYIKKVKWLAGCTLLGDGSISLILDIGGFFDDQR